MTIRQTSTHMPNSLQTATIQRHDSSPDKSLKPFSAVDEYLLQTFTTLEKQPRHLCIYNDRFGFLTCHLQPFNPTIIITQKSQEKAMVANLKANGIPMVSFSNPLATLEDKMDFALIKIPKSLALFQLFLEQIILILIVSILVLNLMFRHPSSLSRSIH